METSAAVDKTNGSNAKGALRHGPPPDLPEVPPKSLLSKSTDIWDRTADHPGTALTVDKIIRIFREAEDGFPAQQNDLFEDVQERDGHLRAQANMRNESVSGRPWIIQEGGETEEDKRAAALLEDAMQRVPNTRQAIEHWCTFVPNGYATTETQWGIDDKGLIVPQWFEVIPHRDMVFPKNEPRLVLDWKKPEGVPLEPGRFFFIAARHRLIVMAGLMRTAVFWSLFKTWAERDWVLWCEQFGLPFPYATYDDDTNDDEIKVLVKTTASLRKRGYAVFHRSGELHVLDTKSHGGSAQDTFGGHEDRCDRENSKLFTGATLTSGEGTSAGSYALGRVHENVAFSFTKSDAERISEAFEQQIGVPFCRWNGLRARPPGLKIFVVKDQDPLQRLEIYCRLANEVGLQLEADQVYRDFQIKTPVGVQLGTLKGTKSSGGAGSNPATELLARLFANEEGVKILADYVEQKLKERLAAKGQAA